MPAPSFDTAPAPALVLEGLAVTRGDRTLFRHLSAHLDAGEVVHLRGPNGIGKTSLLEALCGLRPPAAGTVRGVAPEQIHWVGHKNALHPALTPEENLRFWCGQAGADAHGVTPALARLGLGRAATRPVQGLSTGQKRRSALARLLLQHRPWWLLDEPFAGLDADGAALLAGLVAAHRAQGGAVLLTSHQALPAECGAVRNWLLR